MFVGVISYQIKMVSKEKNTWQHPLAWNSPCRGEGASLEEVSSRVRQREVAAKVVRPADLLKNVRYWFTIWLDKIRKAFSS